MPQQQPLDGVSKVGIASEIEAGIAQRQSRIFADNIGVGALKGQISGSFDMQAMDLSGKVGLRSPDTIPNGDYWMVYPDDAGAVGDRLTVASITSRVMTLEWYTSAGDTFPLSPYSGQAYTRTDLQNETFHWDSTRGKWLGELRSLTFGRSRTSSSPFWLYWTGAVALDDSNGAVFPYDITIVEVEARVKVSVTGDLDLHNGATKMTTIGSWSSNTTISDQTMNYDVTGNTASPYKLEIGSVTGIMSNPTGTIFYRRRAT